MKFKPFLHTLPPLDQASFDYLELGFYLGNFYLCLEFFFFPVSGWSWECCKIDPFCFLVRDTKFGFILPTLEFQYRHLC